MVRIARVPEKWEHDITEELLGKCGRTERPVKDKNGDLVLL